MRQLLLILPGATAIISSTCAASLASILVSVAVYVCVCVCLSVLCVPSCAIVDTHRTQSHVHVQRGLFFDTAAAAAGLKRSICAANRYRRRPVIYTLTKLME